MTRSTPDDLKYRDRWRSWNWNANHKWLPDDLANYLLEHRGLRHVSFDEMLDFIVNGLDELDLRDYYAIDRDEYLTDSHRVVSARVQDCINHHEIPADSHCVYYMGADRGDAFYQAFARFGCSCFACGVVRRDTVTARKIDNYCPQGVMNRQRARHESVLAAGPPFYEPLGHLLFELVCPQGSSNLLAIEVFCPDCLHSLFRAGWPMVCDLATAAVRAALGVKVRPLFRRKSR